MESVKVSQFADDLALYCCAENLSTSVEQLQAACKIVQDNLGKLGLELNVVKTKILHFSRKKDKPENIEVTVGDSLIKSSNKARFLGVIFDPHLNFDQHIRTVVKKTRFILNTMNSIIFDLVGCTSWYPS